jgi:hypothetical protein
MAMFSIAQRYGAGREWLRNVVAGRVLDCSTAGRAEALFHRPQTFLSIAGGLSVIVDRLTPAFAGVVNYRFRIIIACIGCLGLLAYAVTVAVRTHRNCPRAISPDVRHFTYARSERVIAFIAIPLLGMAFALAASDLRYLNGFSGAVQGRVIGAAGSVVQGALVDVLNLDMISVASRPTLSDNSGLFVIDIEAARGAPAYVSVAGQDCRSVVPIRKLKFEQVGEVVVNANPDDCRIVLACRPKGA